MTDYIKEFAKELREDIDKLQRYSTTGRSTTHFSTITCHHQKFDDKWYFRLEPTKAVDALNKLFCIAQLYDDEISAKLLNSIFPYEEDETEELIVKFNQEISDQLRKELLDNEIMVQAIKHRIAHHQSISNTRKNLKRLKQEALAMHKEKEKERQNGLQN